MVIYIKYYGVNMKDFRFSLFKSSIIMNLEIYKDHAKKIEIFLSDEAR